MSSGSWEIAWTIIGLLVKSWRRWLMGDQYSYLRMTETSFRSHRCVWVFIRLKWRPKLRWKSMTPKLKRVTGEKLLAESQQRIAEIACSKWSLWHRRRWQWMRYSYPRLLNAETSLRSCLRAWFQTYLNKRSQVKTKVRTKKKSKKPVVWLNMAIK